MTSRLPPNPHNSVIISAHSCAHFYAVCSTVTTETTCKKMEKAMQIRVLEMATQNQFSHEMLLGKMKMTVICPPCMVCHHLQ